MAEDNGAELMLAFKNGDARLTGREPRRDSAFEEIVRRYKKTILNIIYRFIGDRDEAEDLAQDVFVKVYKSRDKYYAGAKFSTWLYRITSNICISFLRRKKILRIISLDAFWNDEEGNRRADFTPAEMPDSSARNPEAVELSREEHALRAKNVRKALANLSGQQRLAAIYRYYNDFSYEEIAEILKTTVPGVKSLLFRANQSLKSSLSGR